MRSRTKVSLVLLTIGAMTATLFTASLAAAASVDADYYSHDGTMYLDGAATIAEAVDASDDGKFVQMGAGSTLTMRFPDHYAAIPDGTTAADLVVDVFDALFPASADIYVGLNGTDWTFVGQYADTANIDLDLEATGPVKFVKLYQPAGLIDLAYPDKGFDLDGVFATSAGTLPYGMITAPAEDAIVYGWLELGATYWDDDPGLVDWAVRFGTCAAGTGTVFGNVDGFDDTFTWDGNLFTASVDTSSWTPGTYCFVFNPREEAGEQDVRLTREFYVSDAKVTGGGQIVNPLGTKNKDWLKISFGGWAYRIGTGSNADGIGEWMVVFHNVGGNSLDGATFEGDVVYAMNFFTEGRIANLKVDGTLNGVDGYTLIVRAEDFGEPSETADTVRFELFQGSVKVYDSLSDFPGNSSVDGTARTWLDRGNMQIETLS